MNIQTIVVELEQQKAKVEDQLQKVTAALGLLRQVSVTPAPVAVPPVNARIPGEKTPSAVQRFLKANPGLHSTRSITLALPEFAGINGPYNVRDIKVRGALASLRRKHKVSGDIRYGWSAR